MTKVTQAPPLSESQRKSYTNIPDPSDIAQISVKTEMLASVYTSDDRFEAERKSLFQNLAMPIAPSAVLPRPGMYVVNNDFGLPILLTRAKDGVVRAFLNACQHRGAILCEAGEAKEGGRLACPYHAWTYSLQGELIGLPQADTFPDLDKKTRGLAALECREAGGLIWVGLNRDGKTDFSSVSDSLIDDLDALSLGDMAIFKRKTYQLHANWKMLIDVNLENYHLFRLHADSVAKMFTETRVVTDIFGPHIRTMSARGNFNRTIPVETWLDAKHMATMVYTLFPNVTIITSPAYISVMVYSPKAAGHTQADYYMLVYDHDPDEKTLDLYNRSWTLMETVLGEEDYGAAVLSQHGLESGALRTVVLGGQEQNICVFHETVERYLKAAVS